MKTILDNAHTWFLHRINYEENLEIVLIEGKKGESKELEIVGVMIAEGCSVSAVVDSRKVKIKFGTYVTWQCVNESFSTSDEYEVRDSVGFFQILSISKYLDYVNENHGWYSDVIGSAKHCRVWTEDEVIDVISFDLPSIEYE